MTRLAMDTDRLGKGEPEFVRLAADLERTRSQLSSVLKRHDKCWGDDKLGKAFEENYLTAATNLATGLTSLVEVLNSVADGIRTMSKGAARTEQDALDHVQQIRVRDTSGATAREGGRAEIGAPRTTGTRPIEETAEQITRMREVLEGPQ